MIKRVGCDRHHYLIMFRIRRARAGPKAHDLATKWPKPPYREPGPRPQVNVDRALARVTGFEPVVSKTTAVGHNEKCSAIVAAIAGVASDIGV